MKIFIPILCLASFLSSANPHNPGGETSVNIKNGAAFSSHSQNMNDVKRRLKFNGGNKFFEEPWAQAAGSVSSQDGLGPLFNNNACQDCHIRDGRGHAPLAEVGSFGEDFSTMLLRVSKSNISKEQQADINATLIANVKDSCLGGQLQHQSNHGIKKEATQQVSYQIKTVEFSDGEEVTLRIPTWHINALQCSIDSDAVFSARVAPPMIGLGLLENISTADILAKEDINDKNQDHISGKANMVFSKELNKAALGRFGWKAGQPSLRQQTAGAFLGDMGLTTELFRDENCMPMQKDCLAAFNGNGDKVDPTYDWEVSNQVLDKVEFYSHHLAVPKRRNPTNKDVIAGEKIFNDIGCASCHTPSFTTQNNLEHPELANQIIYPYTDLLLHDMGEALADFDQHSKSVDADIQVEFRATANEWRTPPLWGIGLSKMVNPKATFLHDGRAQTILEAILWHDGEAKQSQQAVLTLNKNQREQLIAFINDL